MKTVKRTAEYTVFQRGDSRYAVRGKDKKWINGEAKVEILVKEGLIQKPRPKAQPEPEAEPETAAAQAGAGEAEAQSGEDSKQEPGETSEGGT